MVADEIENLRKQLAKTLKVIVETELLSHEHILKLLI